MYNMAQIFTWYKLQGIWEDLGFRSLLPGKILESGVRDYCLFAQIDFLGPTKELVTTKKLFLKED